ncbi:MAG: SusD/RagB family nutrient-binding outer membrane lipoprotein [Saprospiraceae bacterium]|nr:SusD/RagB family nutrient-binding outer membrane lipoprotein [Saprospiraceae bacterium]
MKNLINKFWVFMAIAVGLGITSCSDVTELNVDPNSPTAVPASNLVTQAQFALYDRMHSRVYNGEWTMLMVQHWAQNEYAEESRYLADRNTFDGTWVAFYASVLNELTAAKGIIEADENIPPARKANQLAIIEVLMVDAFHAATDAWGDIPYTQAINPEFPNPSYDSQQAIYTDLLSRLDAAIGSMDASTGSFDSGDVIYGGDVASWKKLAASIMMRMAMRISDVDGATAATYVTRANDAGVLESTADNALFVFDAEPDLSNPLYRDNTLNNRDDFAVTDVLIDHLKATGDPRLEAYAALTPSGDYNGMPYGLTDAEAFALKSTTSRPSDAVRSATAPHVVMDFAEVAFLKAEAVERGIIAGDAAAYYDMGVAASMEYWGFSDASAFLAANPYDAANWKESIGTAKWVAFYMNGPQAWSEWRRLDYPQLAVPAAASNPVIPVRLPYPVSEETNNGSSLSATTSNIDDMSSKLWWDVN